MADKRHEMKQVQMNLNLFTATWRVLLPYFNVKTGNQMINNENQSVRWIKVEVESLLSVFNSQQFPSALWHIFGIFQLIVLVFWLTTLRFWFTLITLISVISRCSKQLFYSKKSDKPTEHYLPNTKRETKLATSW